MDRDKSMKEAFYGSDSLYSQVTRLMEEVLERVCVHA